MLHTVTHSLFLTQVVGSLHLHIFRNTRVTNFRKKAGKDEVGIMTFCHLIKLFRGHGGRSPCILVSFINLR
jgi:hypothetical protein